jgi:hypothetical protein
MIYWLFVHNNVELSTQADSYKEAVENFYKDLNGTLDREYILDNIISETHDNYLRNGGEAELITKD